MRRFLLFLAFLFFLYSAWTVLDKLAEENKDHAVLQTIKLEIDPIKDKIVDGVEYIVGIFDKTTEQIPETKQKDSNLNENQKLDPPTDQIFSLNNIELGDSKVEVEQKLGLPKRTSLNEYGTEWNTYHNNYQNFVMVSYNPEDKVSGLYTNQDLVTAANGIKIGSTKDEVRSEFGEPMSKILKGNTYYQFQENRDFDMFQLENSFVTIFYDKHLDDTVNAVQIISEELENAKSDFYPEASEELIKGFEYQLFDVTNAARVKHGFSILTWDDSVKTTARKHSKDMAENEYFNHTNLDGQSPFDRMIEDGIIFTSAGENLAYGQNSSIFAHEGLMNSLGHRENILKPDFEFLGVGVAFNSKSQPYYTENYYAN